MGQLRRVFVRALNLVRPGRAERELGREVESHLNVLREGLERRGAAPGEARLAARRALVGGERGKEHPRAARSFRWLDETRRDLVSAIRMLARTPGFTFVAAGSLALGIGANAAIFSLADALLLRPLPVAHPADVVAIRG